MRLRHELRRIPSGRQSEMRLTLERAANWCIILTAVVAAAVLLSRLVSDARYTGSTRSARYQIGDSLPSGVLTDLALSGQDALMIVVNSRCTFCTDSMPFYQRILEHRARSHAQTRIVAVGLEPKDTIQTYLRKNNVFVDTVTSVELRTLKVTSTPTLLLVNRSGKISGIWTGRLTADEEADVLSHLGADLAAVDQGTVSR
jgi:hypothetical protein